MFIQCLCAVRAMECGSVTHVFKHFPSCLSGGLGFAEEPCRVQGTPSFQAFLLDEVQQNANMARFYEMFP